MLSKIYKISFLVIILISVAGFSLERAGASLGSSLEVGLNVSVLPPEKLKVNVLSDNYAQLSWSSSPSDILGYYIYRNGIRLTSVSEASYLDQSLSPGTQYRYQVSAYDIRGNESELTSRVFVETPQIVPPPGENSSIGKFNFLPESEGVSFDGPFLSDYGQPNDVSNLSLSLQNKKILISWSNPSEFDNVYIVRSSKFYPESRFSGWPLWQGRGDSYLDEDFQVGSNYYGVFVCSKDKLCSPGAYAVARMDQGGELLLTSTTTVDLAKRRCKKRDLSVGQNLLVTLASYLRYNEFRFHFVHIHKDGEILAVYKMSEDKKRNLSTSGINLTIPGIYYYEIESYDIYGAGRKSLSCGELTVVNNMDEVDDKGWFDSMVSVVKNKFKR